MVSPVTPYACSPGASTPRLPTRRVFLPDVLDTPYNAKSGPRDTRSIRARPTFEVVLTAAGAAHFAERGQAGRAVVLALCGARLEGHPRVTLDDAVWVRCDQCRHRRVEGQRWTSAS